MLNEKVDTAAVLMLPGIFMGKGSERVSGQAKIYQQKGKYYLALENFTTTNGPDLKVYRNYKVISMVIVIVAATAIIICYGFMNKTKKSQQTPDNKKQGFAVVELFTSEGCSSCPPADEAIAELLAKNNPDIFILSFHVDYWNRLGWKDEFSKHAYSERQQQYARYLSLESIYTPQVIVNGTNQFVGSNESQLNAAIKTSLQNEQQTDFKVTAEKKNNSLAITYNIEGKDAVLLNLALVQPHASTQVKAGENGGKTLSHVNVVRELKVIEAKGAGELSIEIPKELLNTSFQLIPYIQSNKNYKVLGAEQVNF